MNPPTFNLLFPLAAAFCHAVIWFLLSLIFRRNDVADVGWCLGILMISLSAMIGAETMDPRAWVALALVGIWSLRLSIHIGIRNAAHAEDFRYLAFRKRWGNMFHLKSFLQVFLLQSALAVIVSSPVIYLVIFRGPELGFLDMLGVGIWGTGLGIEDVADWQLSRFKADPTNRGRLMTRGLWNYSRHPNYFGEVLLWWGVWVMTLSVPGGWATVVGPMTLSFLILKVSGIPMLESKYRSHPEFAEYAKRTSSFIPWIPGGAVR